jgi:molecular chaperone GrpE
MTNEEASQQDNTEMNQAATDEAEGAAEAIQQAPIEDVETLKSELEDWKEKANEYLEGWQRARADYANYKKRVEREQAQMYQNASANVIRRFLEVMDDLDLALKNLPMEGNGAGWAEGVELIYRKLSAILEAEGVSVINADGQFFDPNLHEAITHEEHPELESGRIIAVVKQGYRLGDRVLRPAQVRVAS